MRTRRKRAEESRRVRRKGRDKVSMRIRTQKGRRSGHEQEGAVR